MKADIDTNAPTIIADQLSTRQNLLNKGIINNIDQSFMTIQLKSLTSRTSNMSSNFGEVGTKISTKRTSSRISYLKADENISDIQMDSIGVHNNKQQIEKEIGIKDEKQIRRTTYDIWDLTYTLMSSKIPIYASIICFTIFLLIRYYTVSCLIYIAVHSHDQYIKWILAIICDRIIYMILVVKISLQTPETKTQIILKSHWNSKQTQINQLFQVVQPKKLIISIIRGLIPAQFAFLYIKAQPRRKFELYVAMNFINSSIQAIVYYPFFIIYCSILTVDDSFSLNKHYKNATIVLAAIGECMMIVVTIILIILGVKRKYGKIFFWL